jgi:DNA primase
MSVVDEIKGRLDVVDVVGSYVPLKKAGRTFKAPCPFHTERTPSFVVDPARQSWHCFGACSEGGDIFSFVMKKEGLDFAGALRLLAQRAGVELEPRRPDQGPDERERLRQAHEAASLYYHNILLNSPAADPARRYLLEKRHLTQDTIRDFHLGFSLDSWDGLKRHLLDRGFSEAELVQAGLLRRREEASAESGNAGHTYDTFRGRIMFPIWDGQGRAVGFGSRGLTPEQLPKYLNSPQSPTFDKSSTLYPLHKARQAIRHDDRAVIVEGYLDAIVAHQYGLQSVVASLGTSLTEQQVGLLKGLTKRIVFALDPDAAGDHATLRGIGVASEALEHKVVPVPTSGGLVRFERVLDAEILVAALPQGQDPDEIIIANVDAWRRLVDGAQPVTDYLFQSAAARHDLAQVEGRAALVKELLPAVAELKDPVRRAHYLQRLATLARVEERALNDELRSVERGRSRGAGQAVAASLPVRDPLEERLLAILVQNPGLRAAAKGLSPTAFERPDNRACFEALRGAEPGESPAAMALPPELQERWEQLRAATLPPADTEVRRKEAADCVLRLKERALRRRWAQSGNVLADAYTELRTTPGAGEDAEAYLHLFQEGSPAAAELGQLFQQQGAAPERASQPAQSRKERESDASPGK